MTAHPRRRSAFTSRLVNTTQGREQPRPLEDMRQAILSGAEPPGTIIPIDAVAQFFGISQIPVREALKVLLGEGLVEHVPRVGYSVAKLTFAEFKELYEVREALEASALRQSVLHATAADDEHVRQHHEALHGALTGGNEQTFHTVSRSFHLALITPSSMHRLLHMYEAAWNVTEPARPMSRVDPVHRAELHADHERMLAAFIARDTDTLVAESARHYQNLRSAISSFRDDPDVFRQPG